MIPAIVVALTLMTVWPMHAQEAGSVRALKQTATRSTRAVRNPASLKATQLLGPRAPGVAPRIRFEWEQVAGAATYVLTGQWTGAQSWALRSTEYRVTVRNATQWEPSRVAFDVSLPEGNHSWRLVALFSPNETGDFEHPAQLSFDVR